MIYKSSQEAYEFVNDDGSFELLNVPSGVVKWKIRMRIGEFTRIFLKFEDGRFECRYVDPVEKGKFTVTEIVFALNKTSK